MPPAVAVGALFDRARTKVVAFDCNMTCGGSGPVCTQGAAAICSAGRARWLTCRRPCTWMGTGINKWQRGSRWYARSIWGSRSIWSISVRRGAAGLKQEDRGRTRRWMLMVHKARVQSNGSYRVHKTRVQSQLSPPRCLATSMLQELLQRCSSLACFLFPPRCLSMVCPLPPP